MNPRNFFAELKRRNVYRVAVAYAVVAWLLIQVTTQVFPFFEIPNWVVRLVVLLLVLGLPLAAVLAWAFEITPEGIVRAEKVPPNESISPRPGKLAVVTVLLALIATGLFSLRLWPGNAGGGASGGIDNKSVAVLPFENLSEDKANAFFAYGIQDEILTALAKISGLKVISRTSTARYQSSPANLPEIARELRVANILEGSVQKSGDRVHINVQLIRAETDAHLWAESYDRGLADIFAVEAEVARSVADALRTALSPEEKARVETKPTNNPDAYVLYLRAREFQTRPTYLLEDYQMAERLYSQAVALDPNFAVARARLSATLAYTYLNFQPSEAIKSRARAEAEEALRLRPDLGEGHLARALCLYWTQRDYEGASREMEVVSRLLPNDVEVDSVKSYILRRQGRWSEALAGMERALVRDPRNALITREVLNTKLMLRAWPDAARASQRALDLAPDLPTLRIEASYVDFLANGEVSPLRAALMAIPQGIDPDGVVTVARWDAALLARDFPAADSAVADCTSNTILTALGQPLPKEYLRGCVALARGDSARAQTVLEAARPALEAEVLGIPLDPFRHAQLGLLYAYLERKEDAVREGRRAVELLPESKDAVDGAKLAGILALIYARTGDADQALALVEHLLRVAGPVGQVFEGSITLTELRLRWQWDPLRNDPRFQKILAGPEPTTIYK